jgi:putative ABC transport system substrate-binding protein
MRRRDFMTLLGGAAASWPLAARAQPPPPPMIGFLNALPSNGPEEAAFRKGLAEVQLVEGRGFAIEFRHANNDYSRLPSLAAELVQRRAAVIYANGGIVAVRATKEATSTIPIVFAMGADPVASGVVESLDRPGGNVTGVAFLSTTLGPKRLGLLQELVPAATRYALLVNPANPATDSIISELRTAAESIDKQIDVFNAKNAREIDSAFADMAQRKTEALVVGASSLFNNRAAQLATLATHYHLPSIFPNRRNVEFGGLMSYGANIMDAVRQAGHYVGRILKGEKPAELPVSQSVKFDFVVNLGTARTLGINVPATLLAIADEVIE